MHKEFFSRLSYSFGNEDSKTELEALRIKKDDAVVCITGSGDRPLHLLLGNPKKIFTVDANPAQNHLFEVKKRALVDLSFENYLGFLGATKDKKRLKTWNELAKKLPADTKEFFDKRKRSIKKGLIYQGAVEKLCQVSAFAIYLLRRKKVETLFSFSNVVDQKAFLHSSWNSPMWKAALAFFLSPVFTKFFKDPGLYAYVDREPGIYIYERMNQYLENYLASESPLFSLVCNGEVKKEAFPPYLQEEPANYIKNRVHIVQSVTENVIAFLESQEKESIDAFSLSDIISYLSYEDFQRLLYAMKRTGRKGARFCMRQFLSDYQIPKELSSFFSRDKALEESLSQKDNCMFYRFFVGEIR